MVLILLVLGLSVIIGFLRGGRLQLNLPLRGLWLAPGAFLLQVSIMWFPGTKLALVLMLVTYGLIIYCLALNSQHQSLRMLLLGVVLNLVVIAANGGRIPVDVDLARGLGIEVEAVVNGTDFKHAPISDTSHLAFLGDVVPLPGPIARVISIGDVVVILGLFLLVQDLMGKRVHISLGPRD